MALHMQMLIFKAKHWTFLNSWVDNFLGFLQNLQMNYFSKTSLDGYFKLTDDISLKCKAQGRVALFYRKTLQVRFWKIKI